MGNGMFGSVGYSNELNSSSAAEIVAQHVLGRLDGHTPRVGILFYSRHHNASEVVETVARRLGEVDLVGGVSPGLITNDTLLVDQPYVALAVLSGDSFSVETFYSADLRDSEFNVGASFGSRLRTGNSGDTPQALLFYDSVKQVLSEGAPALNMATPLLSGLESEVGSGMTLVGIGMVADPRFDHPASVVCNRKAVRHAASLSRFTGNVRLDSLILHGCTPESGYHTVTKSEGPVVLEIDNKAAIQFIQEALGKDTSLKPKDYPLFLTLGINRGEKFDDFDPTMYANRLCLAVDEGAGALIMFEPDLTPGTEIQIMKRSMDFSYIETEISGFRRKLEDREVVFALYLDCLGRWSRLCGTDEEEAELVRQAVGPDIPLIGVYSGVEVSTVGGHLQPLDWTGVLCFLSVPR